MSLQVWLPLNGNLNNQGLANVTVTNYSATVSNDGKIGKCYSFNGSSSYIKVSLPSNMTTLKNTTTCMWIKKTSGNHAGGGISHNGDYYACCTLFGGRWQFVNNNKWTYYPNSYSVDSEWHHFACVVDNSKIYCYVDGSLNYSTDIGITLMELNPNINFIEIGADHPGGDEWLGGYINDFRIYDNALSAKEVKEISKGLCLHYPMNDFYAIPLYSNKYSGLSADGCADSSNFNFRAIDNGKAFNYSLSYTGTGSNTWRSIAFPNFSFTAGKTYDYSCKVRCNKANAALFFRASRVYNDWTTNAVNVSNADRKWHEYHLKQTINSTFTRDGSTITCNPCLEFYSASLDTSGTVFTYDIDIKDVQVVESDADVPFIDNNVNNSNVLADTSGLSNSTTLPQASSPTYYQNSPRYEGSYRFNGSSQFIVCPTTTKITDELTVNLWGYMSTWNGNGRLISCTEAGGWNLEDGGSGYINFPLAAGGAYRSCTSSVKWSDLSSGWHMFTATYDGKTQKLYIDGVLNKELTSFSTKTPITYNSSNTIFIGAEAGSSMSTPEGNYFNGCISDVRMYATALSASDIKELYDSPISITNTGILITKGEFKEE